MAERQAAGDALKAAEGIAPPPPPADPNSIAEEEEEEEEGHETASGNGGRRVASAEPYAGAVSRGN